MRWIASLALILVLTGVTRAAGPDDQYLDIYNEIGAADSLAQGGQPQAAASKYVDAQARLKKIKEVYPDWNPDVVSFRLNYISDKLVALGNAAQPAAATPAAPAPTVPAAPVARPDPALLQQIAALQEQVRSLLEERAEMGNKLKEALSIQPAPSAPLKWPNATRKLSRFKRKKICSPSISSRPRRRKPPQSRRPAERLLPIWPQPNTLLMRQTGNWKRRTARCQH